MKLIQRLVKQFTSIDEAKKVKAGRGNMHIDIDPDVIPDKFSGPKWMGQMEKKHGMMIRFRKDSYVISGQKKGIVSFVTTELDWDQDDIENMWPDLLESTLYEARVKDNDKWNGNPESATMNYIAKDFMKQLGRNGKPYMDDDSLVLGDGETVMTVKDNTSVADLKKAVAKWVAKNVKADPGGVKVGKFSAILPTEMKGVLGNKAVKLDSPRVIIKTDAASAKQIQAAVKGTGKFRMMKRKDHVAVYLDFKDGDELKAAMAKVKKIK
tara:strand:+ start:574 stop:1374 length:801 start_codon:yes stop_codon:yes gene_type:complete